ncbi:uncharacterized protein LOC104584530 [Brachypodium distachyon]|uniref:uncharacterized protein LOC104584530 n=1 Tax=Brachypodium distachyon TaxID=15368 RepID=UPI00052FFF47|nr:uncharacterized protein LOC104584530 [Brachypodium distachyon]|eukprot:XP_010237661.1 uncharacterized protein LOC104584530 [Brachypodium distachyon]
MSCSWTSDGVAESCGSCSDRNQVPDFEEVSSPVLSIPFWIEDPNFCGEQDGFACKCGLRLGQRVAFQGVDLGRRFVSCPKVDDSMCGFMVWIDPEHSMYVKTGLERLWSLFNEEQQKQSDFVSQEREDKELAQLAIWKKEQELMQMQHELACAHDLQRALELCKKSEEEQAAIEWKLADSIAKMEAMQNMSKQKEDKGKSIIMLCFGIILALSFMVFLLHSSKSCHCHCQM